MEKGKARQAQHYAPYIGERIQNKTDLLNIDHIRLPVYAEDHRQGAEKQRQQQPCRSKAAEIFTKQLTHFLPPFQNS